MLKSVKGGARGAVLAVLQECLHKLGFSSTFTFDKESRDLIGLIAGDPEFMSQWVKFDPCQEIPAPTDEDKPVDL